MIHITRKDIGENEYEFVERKGLGHPDTLSDALAEYLSVKYSNYTLENFGAVLHHNFDKVGLLGGASSVQFGKGNLTKPIRVLINGRASTKFGEVVIPIQDLLITWARDFLLLKLPMINGETDLEFHYNLSNQSSPGKIDEENSGKGTRKHWFEPRNLGDLQELKKLVSNDTSMGVGYAPYSKLEQIIIDIEKKFNSVEFREDNLWIGSDIKIMGFRHLETYDITLCIPQISTHVHNLDQYKDNIKYARGVIEDLILKAGIKKFEIHINTRDNYDNCELYLTVTGSSIESGDEGLVGRGNRINGVISPMHLMSMEGACGKNPVYHIGKIYYVAANEISKKIHNKFGIANEVVLISQSGRDLLDPWVTFIAVPTGFDRVNEAEEMVRSELKNIPNFTKLLLEGKISLY